jgi:2-dehydro-3-deoxyphosphooctonate aldolase (KDO 8-P synthase)
MIRSVNIGSFTIGGEHNPLFLISGPCVIEDEKTVMITAERIKKDAEKLHIPCIFKSSYKKDNRGKATSYQGPGLDEGLRILEKVREQFEMPILSDVHGIEEVAPAAGILDVVQIPAFLSQQTGLTLEVGKHAKAVNVKKGQFLAPEDMQNAISKLTHAGNENIILTERGTMFGYHRLVVDMRSFEIMRTFGYPVVFDVTHSVRIYGIPSKDAAGGEPQFIFPLAKAGIAAGADGIFIETHPDLSKAKCDASSMLPLDQFSELLGILKRIHEVVKARKRKE